MGAVVAGMVFSESQPASHLSGVAKSRRSTSREVMNGVVGRDTVVGVPFLI